MIKYNAFLHILHMTCADLDVEVVPKLLYFDHDL